LDLANVAGSPDEDRLVPCPPQVAADSAANAARPVDDKAHDRTTLRQRIRCGETKGLQCCSGVDLRVREGVGSRSWAPMWPLTAPVRSRPGSGTAPPDRPQRSLCLWGRRSASVGAPLVTRLAPGSSALDCSFSYPARLSEGAF